MRYPLDSAAQTKGAHGGSQANTGLQSLRSPVLIARRLCIISGVSGSGKSTALNAYEDLGFFCVDNLPTPLISQFVDFLLNIPPEWHLPEDWGRSLPVRAAPRDFALLVDCREKHSVEQVLEGIERLEKGGTEIVLLYLDCTDEILMKRFQETRRPHPLLLSAHGGHTIADALTRERELLAEFRSRANFIIESTSHTPHDLRRLVGDTVGEKSQLHIVVTSFGFKYGLPTDVDLVCDVRFLPNPHFVPALKPLTGLDEKVSEYVFQKPDGEELVKKYTELLQFLVPRYQAEGKRYLTVGIGCTGGQHRSVAIAERLMGELGRHGFVVAIRHRDIGRG